MNTVREFLETKPGKSIGIAISIGFILITIFAVRASFKSDLPDSAFSSVYVCSETGREFRHKNEMGETIPIRSPYSGKNTGYPAEACYWNADGTVKKEPTWVLLNEAVDDKAGPTFCPDCGRLVVSRNPKPGPDSKPPPTEAEYRARRSARPED